jgi:hypothetical protein
MASSAFSTRPRNLRSDAFKPRYSRVLATARPMWEAIDVNNWTSSSEKLRSSRV